MNSILASMPEVHNFFDHVTCKFWTDEAMKKSDYIKTKNVEP